MLRWRGRGRGGGGVFAVVACRGVAKVALHQLGHEKTALAEAVFKGVAWVVS